jgi:glutamine synthetase
MVCLTHEKPFAGVNGSGKHVNYSLGSASVGNLLEPGDTPHDNERFLVFVVAVVRAISTYAPLLRSVVASAGNDHRLGANEAPPAIISVFLGDQLSDIFAQIRAAGTATSSKKTGTLTLGVDTLPPLPLHAGDRNRTSPFAFTGNKFEFRAVGANQSIAMPITVLNTIIAESLDYMATRLEAVEGDFHTAVQTLLKEVLDEHSAVLFDGDGYSEDWHREAAARGLPNLRTTVDALPAFGSPEAVALFEKYNVLSHREVESRLDVKLEQYVKAVNLEAKLTLEMGRTMIWPAAIRHQSQLAVTCANLKAVGYEFDTNTLDKVTELVKLLQDSLTDLKTLMEHESNSLLAEAEYACSNLVPQMALVRGYADELEGLVADDLWPLPTYQEMLFIK